MIRRISLAVLLIVVATSASATRFVAVERLNREMPIFIGGTVVVDNDEGDIEVIGSDEPGLSVAVIKTIRGLDDAALNEGKQMTQAAFTGDDRQRVMRTWISPLRSGRWVANVSYSVRVPRTVNVTILSGSSNRIRITDMRSNIQVKNVNGAILLERFAGAGTVESVNGNIVFHAPGPLPGDVRLGTINGTVEVHAPSDTAFRWKAETVTGDIRTTFPAQGNFNGSAFNGVVNGPSRVLLHTKSFMGGVTLLRTGSKVAEARSVKQNVPQAGPQINAGTARHLKLPIVQGIQSFQWHTSIGNVEIGELRAIATTIETGAGSIQIGSIHGSADVRSLGGPLSLGNIQGDLRARTAAGDIIVQSVRGGGSIVTGGGIIRLLYMGGPMRLESGGGDIDIRRAAGPVSAETRSGDISIALDPGARSQRVAMKTAKGNLLLTVAPGFGADIDATILTDDPTANAIRSDFTGLTVQRDQVNGKTRIRATGRINGGGERVELSAENGGIQITSQTPAARAANAPR